MDRLLEETSAFFDASRYAYFNSMLVEFSKQYAACGEDVTNLEAGIHDIGRFLYQQGTPLDAAGIKSNADARESLVRLSVALQERKAHRERIFAGAKRVADTLKRMVPPPAPPNPIFDAAQKATRDALLTSKEVLGTAPSCDGPRSGPMTRMCGKPQGCLVLDKATVHSAACDYEFSCATRSTLTQLSPEEEQEAVLKFQRAHIEGKTGVPPGGVSAPAPAPAAPRFEVRWSTPISSVAPPSPAYKPTESPYPSYTVAPPLNDDKDEEEDRSMPPASTEDAKSFYGIQEGGKAMTVEAEQVH